MIMGLLSLAFTVIRLYRKNGSSSGTIVFGITVFIGLFLVDALTLSRFWGASPHASNSGIDLAKEYDRLVHGGLIRRMEMLLNILVFVPLGFFLFETLGALTVIDDRRRIGVVSMIAFLLSLGIESIQQVLHVGFFEMTDLIMNTIGGFVGAGIAFWGRTLRRRFRAKMKSND